ncbi:MAG: PAS domain S-box protein [Candidatus Eremiobacterota bacterium]
MVHRAAWVLAIMCLVAAAVWPSWRTAPLLAVAVAVVAWTLLRPPASLPPARLLRPVSDLVVVVSGQGTIQEVNEQACETLGYRREELLGQPVDCILDGPGLGADSFSYRNLETRLRTRDGTGFPVLLSCSVLDGTGLVLSAHDLSERRRLEDTQARLEDLLQAPLVGIARLDPQGCLKQPNHTLNRMLGSPAEGQELAALLLEPERSRLRDYLSELRRGRRDSFQLEGRLGSGAWINLVAFRWGEGHGVMVQDITSRRQAELELAHAQERLQQLVDRLVVTQEEERRSVARDLHDGLLQAVIAAEMELQGLSRRVGGELDGVRTILRQSVEEGRRLIHNLRPATLEQFGLPETLRRQVHDLLEERGWEGSFCSHLETELPPAMETTLYRIAQEALNNVRKHSETGRLKVRLEDHPEGVVLEVQDWGRGFDPSQTTAAGMGLPGMRERAELAGGRLEIVSHTAQGTLVRAVIPRPGRAALP